MRESEKCLAKVGEAASSAGKDNGSWRASREDDSWRSCGMQEAFADYTNYTVEQRECFQFV